MAWLFECQARPALSTGTEKGDYFASTERESGTLCVHQLSTRNSQVDFHRSNIVLSKLLFIQETLSFLPQQEHIFECLTSENRRWYIG